MKTLSFLVALSGLSCGGVAVIEDGAGGSGNDGGTSITVGNGASSAATKGTSVTAGSTKASATTATGAASCDQLGEAHRKALEEAVTCNACLDFDPCGTAFVPDQCGCIVPATSAELAGKVQQAYDAWVAAGCGPLACETCPSGSFSFCSATGLGCGGTCALSF